MHHANAYGGPTLQIQMLERYYKVSIDNYAIVNSASLPKVIDAMGGGRSFPRRRVSICATNADSGLSTGKNTLSGQEALIYMRIRENIGGDEARCTGTKSHKANCSPARGKATAYPSILCILNTMIPYIRTGLSSTDMLGYATNALTNGWLHCTSFSRCLFPTATAPRASQMRRCITSGMEGRLSLGSPQAAIGALRPKQYRFGCKPEKLNFINLLKQERLFPVFILI
ncbi:MAG: LCP family protein [Lachnoclostridium sp.]